MSVYVAVAVAGDAEVEEEGGEGGGGIGDGQVGDGEVERE